MSSRVDFIPVTPEYLLQADVTIDELHRLMKRTLALPNYWDAFSKLLKLKRSEFIVDLLTISRILNSSEFTRQLFQSAISRCVSLTNKIIKVSAYMLSRRYLTHEDIRIGLFVHEMLSRKTNYKFAADVPLIMKAMRAMNKIMSEKLIEIWLKANKSSLIDPGFVNPYEFLFLVANAKDRLKLLNKLPRCERSVKPNKKTRLFTIDDAVKSKKSPDSIIQESLNHEVEMQKNLLRHDNSSSRPLNYAEERLKALNETLSSSNPRNRSVTGLDSKIHEELWSVISVGMRHVKQKKSSFTSDTVHHLIKQVIPASFRPSSVSNQKIRKQLTSKRKILAHKSFIMSDDTWD